MWSFFCLFLLSCSGYRFQSNKNPFAQYSIKTLSVPMFYNKSNLGNVSGAFTTKIFRTLTPYSGLTLIEGNGPADAVLIGVIESNEKRKDSILTETSRFVDGSFGNDFLEGKRNDFLVPSSLRVMANLRIMVIKHPTQEEIEFLQTDTGAKALSSKVIFNEVIPLSAVVPLKRRSGESISVIGSQNRGVYKVGIDRMATQAALNFKNMILYAF